MREDRVTAVSVAFGLIGLLNGYLPAYAVGRRFGLSTAIPFAGLAWFSSLPVVRCGFGRSLCSATGSAGCAIQPGHTLVTSGIYGVIRNPSYLGLLVYLLGWGLAFRSGVGVFLTALMVPPLVARIRAEEVLQICSSACARTCRLIPGSISGSSDAAAIPYGKIWIMPWLRWQSAVDFLGPHDRVLCLLRWAHSTRALRIGLGVVGIHALALLARHFDLVITSWVLDVAAILAVVLLLLIFQPELRRRLHAAR